MRTTRRRPAVLLLGLDQAVRRIIFHFRRSPHMPCTSYFVGSTEPFVARAPPASVGQDAAASPRRQYLADAVWPRFICPESTFTLVVVFEARRSFKSFTCGMANVHGWGKLMHRHLTLLVPIKLGPAVSNPYWRLGLPSIYHSPRGDTQRAMGLVYFFELRSQLWTRSGPSRLALCAGESRRRDESYRSGPPR